MKRLLTFSLLAVMTAGSLFSEPLTLSKRERDRLKKETVYAIDLIQRYHYKQTRFEDIPAEDMIRAYINDLDSSRLFLLQEDVDFILARFKDSLKPSYLFVGDLYPAFEIFNSYKSRVSERLDWIEERLQQPFPFDTDKTYVRDREDADWPADIETAHELWEKRLTHELLNEVLENEPLDRAVEKVAKRYERMRKFVEDIEVHNVQETFLTALASLYDPHSNFFSYDSAKEFDIQISNSLVGIGAQLRDVDGYCVIERLLPGGPAEMSGKLHPGDKIVAVAQGEGEPVDVVGMKLRKIVQKIRGESGTEVRLTVLPAHSTKRKTVSLIREKIELTANLASAEIHELPTGKDRTTRVGVIRLPSFYGEGTFGEGDISTSGDVKELLEKLKDRDVEAVVLDLRENGGGRLDEAIKMTGLFISKGPVVMKRSYNGEVEEDWDRNPDVTWQGPLVVLVSRSSASASEIVAGALQSLNRAVVVGDESTHGKGTVQAPIDLQNAMRSLPFTSALEVGTVKITVQQFFLPNGESTQKRGVLSDIAFPSANEFLLEGEADLDHALAWDKIDPIAYRLPERKNEEFATVSDSLLDTLELQSSSRKEQLEEFAYLRDNVDWYRERHEKELVSLHLEKREREKEQLENRREVQEERRDALSEELGYPVTSVDLALTEEKEAAHQEKLRTTPLPNGEDRANAFYQKVFYYKDPETKEIHEIWVEYFDYEEVLPESGSIAVLLKKETGIDFSTEDTEEILTRLKNRDLAGDFNILDPFAEVLGERHDKETVLAAMPAFFGRLVELDPDVLLERPKLDVHLRESLRIARDWAVLHADPPKPEIAAKIKEDPEDS